MNWQLNGFPSHPTLLEFQCFTTYKDSYTKPFWKADNRDLKIRGQTSRTGARDKEILGRSSPSQGFKQELNKPEDSCSRSLFTNHGIM